jgi:hypothetical protein
MDIAPQQITVVTKRSDRLTTLANAIKRDNHQLIGKVE